MEVYNLHRHTECVIIYIGKNEATVASCPTSNRFFKNTSYKRSSESACITYDKQKTKILDWGNLNYAASNLDCIEINNFMVGLYDLFKKGKNNWDEEDIFFVQAVSDFMRLKMTKLVEEPERMIESLDMLHYIFVVSSEWEEEIREELLRPIFVQSNLVSSDDHKDRVLFYTDLECIFYYKQQEILSVGEILTESFRKQRYNIMCRVTSLNCHTLSIQFDLIETQHSLYDLSGTMLFPRVLCSSEFSITTEKIKIHIKEFLERNMFPNGTNTDQNELIPRLTDHIYFSIVRQMFKYYKSKGDNGLMKPWMTDTKRWGLNEPQAKFIRSIRIFDICTEIGKDYLRAMSNLLSSVFRKNYKLFVIKDMYSFKPEFHPSLFAWLNAILESNRDRLSYTIMTTKKNTRVWSFYSTHIIKGAAVTAFEAIRNSEIYAKPCILSKNIVDSSSPVILNENPNAIFHIDISFESTLLSYSVLNEHGYVEKTFDNCYFVANKCLPCLGLFYQVSNTITLNIDEEFISITKDFPSNDLNFLLEKTEDILLKFESIITKKYSENTPYVSTQQREYIISFLLMYLVYIKELISSKLFITMNLRIGYVVSIEKRLLDSTIGSKTEFEKLLFASGLITNEDTKKLKVITQGEAILPMIQKFWELEFPIKSCFVLAQLHENYVQLTLNQIATFDSKEAIVLKDEIIHIQNIYDSLCTSIWNHITENNQSIQLCGKHIGNNDYELLGLLSLDTKTKIFSIFRRYISENILKNKSKLKMNDKKMIYLNSNCNCRIHLSIIDVLEIAFKPILQNIASLISAPLINTDYFGKYKNTPYLFSLIYFNDNSQFQIALADMLKEELDCFNEGQEIETICLVIPELSNLILNPIIQQQPFMYKSFQLGCLHQISSANYGFTITQYTDSNVSVSKKPVYREKRTDNTSILCEDIAFLLFKKGEVITDRVFERVFYLKKQSDNVEEVVAIELLKFKEFNGLKPNGTVPLEGNIFRALDYFSFDLKLRNYKKGSDLPIMISMKSKGYSSSFKFSVKEVGQDKKSYGLRFVEVGEPLTLIRY